MLCWPRARLAWIQTGLAPSASCVSRGKQLHLSEPQSLILRNGAKSTPFEL